MGHDHEKYVIQVTAGPSYDESTHTTVNVNAENPIRFSSDVADVSVNARIKNFRGIPPTSPTLSPYFSHPSHTSDLYSLQFHFRLKPPQDTTAAALSSSAAAASSEHADGSKDGDGKAAPEPPKAAEAGIPGTALVFGNDFDRPIRDRLPPGFGTAFKFVRWMVDPGLEGDPYADKPWLYGPLLSSVNVLNVGSKAEQKGEQDANKGGEADVLEEGSSGADGKEARSNECGGGDVVPGDAAARKKFFLDEGRKAGWTWEYGREYRCDFFNPYLDFNEFAVKLPVITLPILKALGSGPDRDHNLRYVLKDRRDGRTIMVVLFKLVAVADLTGPANVPTEDGAAKAVSNVGSTSQPPAAHTEEKKGESTTSAANDPGVDDDDDVD